jgi:hypothetical protein
VRHRASVTDKQSGLSETSPTPLAQRQPNQQGQGQDDTAAESLHYQSVQLEQAVAVFKVAPDRVQYGDEVLHIF